jgi:UDP-N-acetylglucosamine--N-acetylmuramyl-(pentapeptide) pyrophosphoryl-undecaprenol N-acetylglucosamine transferase
MSRILFVGGASIGHIAPSIAVMQQLKKIKSDVQCHFVCLPSKMEMNYLKQNDCVYSTVDSPRLSFSFLWKFPRAYKQASALLSELEPDVIFSKGGHISIPVCLAARKRKIPIVLHESDAVSGRANRIVAKWAEKICTGFPMEEANDKYIHTGNPIRQEVTQGKKKEGLRITGFSGDRPVLLVVGGSQGAEALNHVITHHIHKLLKICDVIHITGTGKRGSSAEDHRYFQREFVHEELPHLYAIADLALSRAGANILSELAANGIPTIIVPLRKVGHDHQQKNAEAAVAMGGCILLDQRSLEHNLGLKVKRCLLEKNVAQSMSKAARNLASPEASLQIAKILSKFLASNPGSH